MITKKSKYAIKALLFLSRHEHRKPVLIEEIARAERIPKKFLEAILLDLRKAGYLGSKKGKGGGYYLIKTPSQIHMAEIMRLFDGAIALVPCVAHRYYEPCEECVDEITCPIREVFRIIREQTVAILKDNTFAELLEKEKKLKRYRK
ncbi:MAG: Rrf2 family transcriptional regulator [Chitinophagales bacterium]|nr:Rrf2 family transcriptional regulator [Chitinophagales bacterium]MDW8420181.1 Rrf2 family transcriptional regulator [Chitinophagales bacterium]